MRSASRRACCTRLVTSTMVSSERSSLSTSSMRMVVTGSTAIENSSSSSSSGSCDRARAMVSRCCCPPESRLPSDPRRSFTSSHSAARRRQRSTMLVELGLAAHAGEARRHRHVVVDRQRQPDRQREHHSDAAAQGIDVAPALDVAAVEQQLALDAHPRRHLVHAVDGAQERGLAGARGTDDAEDLVLVDGEIDVAERRASIRSGCVSPRASSLGGAAPRRLALRSPLLAPPHVHPERDR